MTSPVARMKDLILTLTLLAINVRRCYAADVLVQMPSRGGGSSAEGEDPTAAYRVDYEPPVGEPPPNTTAIAAEVKESIKFSKMLPGTRYIFRLYYSNSTVQDVSLHNATISTVPEPPSNLSVSVINGTSVLVKYNAPKKGEWSSFNFKLISIVENRLVKNLSLTSLEPYLLSDLTPGGTYQIQMATIFDDKESIPNALYNFTTRPNTPTNCLVWFRNETMLKFLWQPPTTLSIYSHYKVVIEPKDSPESVQLVEKGDPPGPANAVFRDLVPGRTYNLSVQSYSEGALSLPISAEYWTVPLRPNRLRVEPTSVTSSSFRVLWDPPDEPTEYDKYRISINLNQQAPVMRNKSEPRAVTFSENLRPGRQYKVSALTVSGKVNSAESIVYVTLKPLPVKNVKASLIDPNNQVQVTWEPAESSFQDTYEVSYTEIYNGSVLNGDTNFMITKNTEYLLESLLPGRNYSISVKAVSNNTPSLPVITCQATRPSAPVIEELRPIEYGLNIAWKSDVNSRQEKYEIRHRRNDSDVNQFKVNVTRDTNILIDNLYPGAGYNIRVYAISHGLKSEPHDYFQAVYPRPPTNLSKENITSSSVTLRWEKPKDSLFSEFTVRFRSQEDTKWTKYNIKSTAVEINSFSPGQFYFIQINSMSYGVESASPININHTVDPSPVTNIASLVDSTNVTVEFPKPPGRIDYYVVNWIPRDKENLEQRTKNVSSSEVSGERVRIMVDQLMPGVLYQFDIHTVSFELHSNPTLFAARTMPLILSELVIVSQPGQTEHLTVRYSPTPQTASRFDTYRFTLQPATEAVSATDDAGVAAAGGTITGGATAAGSTAGGATGGGGAVAPVGAGDAAAPHSGGVTLEKNASDPVWEVTFTALSPGSLYNLSVWTVSDGVLSQPIHRQDRLYPDPVEKLLATHISDIHVTLAWSNPKGEFSSYEIQYMNADGVLVQNLTKDTTCTVENLRPYRNYTFTVTVRSGSDESNYLRRSLPVTATFQTQEGLPGKPTEFHATNILPREVSFAWSLPETEWNGVLKKFTIIYSLEGSSSSLAVDFRPEEVQGTIRDLIPGKMYSFKIQAQTIVGYGPSVLWKEEMPIWAPPKPSSQFVPTEVCRSSSTIQVRFRKNFFSDVNGQILNYTIIVAEDDKKNTSLIEMPSWFDVQAYGIWPPYQVSEPYYPFRNSTVEDYTIGAEDCSQSSDGYCNGPLKSGTVYRVKIRAFTTSNKFTDTDYSFAIQTDTEQWPIILGVSAGVVLVIAAIVAVILIKKYQISLTCGEPEPNKKKVTLTLSDCLIETSKPIKLDKFAAYYEIMSADSDFRFSEEFEQLKSIGREQSCLQADLSCNRPKNRFTNILPYDHSRFKLQPVDDEEGSDYINANYIPGYHSPREFIVTQGPLPSTKDDFWRMCWESNCRAIVMLTKCVEKGREKCDRYWPEDTRRVYYGDISVTISNESYFPHWTITELSVQRGETQRTVRHFHFTTWPDFGVPNPPTVLVNFVRTFRDKISNEPRPIIVHCSAGVGRSGTFIAIDRIMQSLKHGADFVDVFGVVYQMRRERVLMVQTEQQYICIHQCILAALRGPESHTSDDHQNQGFEDDEGIAETGA